MATELNDGNKIEGIASTRQRNALFSRSATKNARTEYTSHCMNYYLRPNSHSIPHVMSIMSLLSSPERIILDPIISDNHFLFRSSSLREANSVRKGDGKQIHGKNNE